MSTPSIPTGWDLSHYLECDHCGGAAVYADDNGMFQEDSGEACLACGMPGHVSVDGDGDDAEAWWHVHDDGRCTDPECDECGVLP